MNKLTKYPSFKVDFLKATIFIILDKNWLKISGKILNMDLANDEKCINSNAIAFKENGDYYIAAPKNVTGSTLYHECFHVLMDLSGELELRINSDNQETGAYLMQYLIDETLKIKKGIKVK